MIEHQVAQGTPAWLALRSGIPTASQFHRIITPKTRKRSSQLEGYARELAAERLLGRPIEKPQSIPMMQGTEREEAAVASYELTHGVDTALIGFVTTDDGKVGASPDRIIRETGKLLECKSPQPQTHIGYLLGDGPDDDYRCQLQGQLYVCEAPSVDIISFYPGLPDVVIHVERDEEFIGLLKVLLVELCGLIDSHMERLARMGYEPPAPDEDEAEDPLGITEADMAAILGATA